MKTILSLAVTFMLMILALPLLSVAQNKGAAEKLAATDLDGQWDGARHPNPNDDWGAVNLKSTEAGFIGTYSDTFNKQLGSVTFTSAGVGKLQGLWWESDLKRYGSFVLEVSQDGRSITVHWKALSEGGARSGKSMWKRK